MTVLLLALSIVLSTGRNLLSKQLSSAAFGTRRFFLCQGILFAFGALALLLAGAPLRQPPSLQTLSYAIVYGILLILAQWFYTLALGRGNTALCSTVYSMGFILPTLSGALIWSEPFSMLDFAGVVCAVFAILCSQKTSLRDTGAGKGGLIPLLVAMLASGGLGIMQKLLQKAGVSDEQTAFLIIAFLLAALLSFLAVPAAEKGKENQFPVRMLGMAATVGIAFGSCNLLNTVLAGRLPSAVFFPTLNIGVIVLTLICGILFFKEKIRKKELLVLLFGGLSIFLLNIS